MLTWFFALPLLASPPPVAPESNAVPSGAPASVPVGASEPPIEPFDPRLLGNIHRLREVPPTVHVPNPPPIEVARAVEAAFLTGEVGPLAALLPDHEIRNVRVCGACEDHTVIEQVEIGTHADRRRNAVWLKRGVIEKLPADRLGDEIARLHQRAGTEGLALVGLSTPVCQADCCEGAQKTPVKGSLVLVRVCTEPTVRGVRVVTLIETAADEKLP